MQDGGVLLAVVVLECLKSVVGNVDNLQHRQLFGALCVAWAS